MLLSAFVDDSSLSVTSRYVQAPNASMINNDVQDNAATIESLMMVAQHLEGYSFPLEEQ